MKRFFKIMTYTEEKLSIIVYTVMLIITFANVIGRYVMHASISFTDEVTTNLFVLLSVLGTAIAVRGRSHLGLSAITELLPLKVQYIISGIANLLGGIFGAVLLYTGSKMVANQIRFHTVSATLQWPNWCYGLFLPLGATFILVRFIQVAFEDFMTAGQMSSNKMRNGADN